MLYEIERRPTIFLQFQTVRRYSHRRREVWEVRLRRREARGEPPDPAGDGEQGAAGRCQGQDVEDRHHLVREQCFGCSVES